MSLVPPVLVFAHMRSDDSRAYVLVVPEVVRVRPVEEIDEAQFKISRFKFHLLPVDVRIGATGRCNHDGEYAKRRIGDNPEKRKRNIEGTLVFPFQTTWSQDQRVEQFILHVEEQVLRIGLSTKVRVPHVPRAFPIAVHVQVEFRHGNLRFHFDHISPVATAASAIRSDP